MRYTSKGLITIPLSEFEFSFVRSSGSGGQNVNKVNSKAVLRWNLWESPSLSDEAKFRVATRLQSRLTLSGDLILTSDRERDQIRNKADCIARFHVILNDALRIEKPRKKTKPGRGSRERAKKKKSLHSEKKRMRSKKNIS